MVNLGEIIKPCNACGYDFKYEDNSQVFCEDFLKDYYLEIVKEESNG